MAKWNLIQQMIKITYIQLLKFPHEKSLMMFGKCFERWHERAGSKTLRQKRSNALLCKNVSVIDILFNFARFAGVPQKGTGNWSIVEIGHVEFTSNTYSKTTKLGFSSLRTPHQALRIQQIVMQTISLEQRTCVRYTYLKCGRAETISFQDSMTRLQWRLQSNLPRFPCSEGMLGWFERSCMDQPLPVPEFLLVFMPGIQPIHLTLESWCMS